MGHSRTNEHPRPGTRYSSPDVRDLTGSGNGSVGSGIGSRIRRSVTWNGTLPSLATIIGRPSRRTHSSATARAFVAQCEPGCKGARALEEQSHGGRRRQTIHGRQVLRIRDGARVQRQCQSQRRRSGSRLVASSVRLGASASSAATSAPAGSTCSKLSRTNSRRCSRKNSLSVSTSLRPELSGARRASCYRCYFVDLSAVRDRSNVHPTPSEMAE